MFCIQLWHFMAIALDLLQDNGGLRNTEVVITECSNAKFQTAHCRSDCHIVQHHLARTPRSV
jgi:hypothetical protein